MTATAPNETLSQLEEHLRESVSALLIPLQTTRALQLDEFERLFRHVNDIARQVKTEPIIAKSLLHEIYTTIQVLRNEAPFFKAQEATLRSMADRLEMSFSLILKGESPEDRVPGVPRIL